MQTGPGKSRRHPSKPDPGLRTPCSEDRLLAALWPFVSGDGVRGEGCFVCPSSGTTCRGVEAEWWNDSGWEEFSDHLG